MSFDASRFSFNPWKDYSGVVMQQGRVQLDSDWNESLAILNRRIQATTRDIFGTAVAPSTTPYGFRITATQTGTVNSLKIGAGRMYVDGLLVENHGPATATFDSALAELSNTPKMPAPGASEVDIDYTGQPFLPGAAAALPTGNGPFLVYLDVWEREVTYLQDPDLIEKAVGIDTTGRLQTAWQVKILDVSHGPPNSVTCSTSLPQWDALIEPSASRLSTKVFQSTGPGPGNLTPNSNYTGMENQLYRVEIHQAGTFNNATTGTPSATFKWSHDNATVMSAVTAIATVGSGTQLTVQSIGKDDVLGFRPGDWIEITDDSRELTGKAGDLLQIAPDGIDATAKTILLAGTVSADILNNLTNPPANYGSCHARIQRWDQKGNVYLVNGTTTTLWTTLGSRGDIPVPPKNTFLLLENGVTVSFDLASGSTPFKVGDYWSFTARSSDGSVQQLTEAPPIGPHHHYARLAVVTFGFPASDCRPPWPPVSTASSDSCACTICIELSDYQANHAVIDNAITTVRNMKGGRVCLGPGLFILTSPLLLDSLQNVRLCGQGPATTLVYSGIGPAVSVTRAWDFRIEDLAIVATYSPPAAANGVIAGVFVQNSLGFALERCSVLTIDAAAPAIAAPPTLGTGPFSILNTTTIGPNGTGVGVVLDGFLIAASFRDNLIIGDIGIGSSASVNLTLANPLQNTRNILALDGIDISRNSLVCTMAAVAVGSTDIATHECLFLGLTDISDNRIQNSQLMGVALAGLTMPTAFVRVDRNYVEARIFGIVGMVDGVLLSDNLVTQPPSQKTPVVVQPYATGIAVFGPIGSPFVFVRASVIRNRVQSWLGSGIEVARLAFATIQDNSVSTVLYNGIITNLISDLRICDNEILGVSFDSRVPSQNNIKGIFIDTGLNALVEGNNVSFIAPSGNANAYGVHINGVLAVNVNGNEVDQIGPVSATNLQSYGIAVYAASTLSVTGNTIQQFGGAATAVTNFQAIAADAAQITGSSATVRDNSIVGASLEPLIMVNVTADCTLTSNFCEQPPTSAISMSPMVQVTAVATAIVANNRCTGSGHNIGLKVTTPKLTLIGNIVFNQIQLGDVNLANTGSPWIPLNIIT